MTKKTEIYQLCPDKEFLMQSYVIKTPNNKIIIIDGGNIIYSKSAYLTHAIRAVLGINAGDYFEIEAWFFSHGHEDHFGEFILMMQESDKDSNYKINNFYFDFPDFFNSKFNKDDFSVKYFEFFKQALKTYADIKKINVRDNYYDALNSSVINESSVKKGLKIIIDGVVFDILQTWSDFDDILNGNSLVIKVYNENKIGKSCLFLNDTSVESGKRLLNTYKEKLKSDIVQMAHHGQAGADKDVYDAIGAEIRLWPTPIWVWQYDGNTQYKINQVRSWFDIKKDNYGINDIVSCCYKSYPKDYTSVSDWKDCLENMKIVL